MDDQEIIGLKDSSGDLGYFELLLKLARDRTDWSFLIGSDHLLVPSLQLGGHGGVCGSSNLFPRLFVEIFERGDHQFIRRVERALGSRNDARPNL